MRSSGDERRSAEPGALEVWLDRVAAGTVKVSPDFNWLSNAFSAAANARESADDTALTWARIALRIYSRLAATDEHGRESYEQSAMMLRAWLIRQRGAVRGDAVLDPDGIVRWFFARLQVPLSEAIQMVDAWPELPLDHLRMLRRIKNRLSVIRALTDVPTFSPDEE